MSTLGGLLRQTVLVGAVTTLLSSCAQTPMGPTVQVMPGQGKSFDAFAADQAACKTYAADQVKGEADQANARAIGGAVLTTALGAGLGASVGNLNGLAGQGAGVGGAAGSVVGASLAAAQTSQGDQPMIQQQYDTAYSQCMYAKGDQVPGYVPQTAAAQPGPVMGADPAVVRSVQTELVRLSYLHGAADGVAGPMTHSAIRAFQKDHGMRVTGSPSQALLARLESTPTGSGGAGAGASATASAAKWVTPAAATAQGSMPQTAAPPAVPAGWVAPTKTQ